MGALSSIRDLIKRRIATGRAPTEDGKSPIIVRLAYVSCFIMGIVGISIGIAVSIIYYGICNNIVMINIPTAIIENFAYGIWRSIIGFNAPPTPVGSLKGLVIGSIVALMAISILHMIAVNWIRRSSIYGAITGLCLGIVDIGVVSLGMIMIIYILLPVSGLSMNFGLLLTTCVAGLFLSFVILISVLLGWKNYN